MAYRAGVVGGSGYTGAELLRLLAGHPEIEVVHVTADSNAGAAVGRAVPVARRRYPDLEYSPFDAAALAGLDLVFPALPHGESQALLPELLDHVGHVVDLGADFRLPARRLRSWYGEAHDAPELLDRFAYGLVRAVPRRRSPRTPHVAAPGCYPTAAASRCAPLFALGLVEPPGSSPTRCRASRARAARSRPRACSPRPTRT